MSRKKKEYRKNDVSDAKYGDPVVGKFINSMMWHGKKSKAEKVFYDALDTIKQRVDKEGFDVFKEAMDNVCLLYTSPSPRDATLSRMPSSA